MFTYDFPHYQPATTRPADFGQFWKDARAESDALPLDIKMTPVPEKTTPSGCFQDQLCDPRRATDLRLVCASRRRPASIRPTSASLPRASTHSSNPETFADRCSLWIQIHGFDVDLSNMPAGDNPGKNYWTAGIESPKTSMWRTIFMSLVRAVDFMVDQPSVDAKRIVVIGGSQGGGLSLAAASLDPRVAFCMPYHSGLRGSIGRSNTRQVTGHST